MNNPIPCWTDSDENRLPAADVEKALAVEDYADDLMDDCKLLSMAILTNRDNDLYDGDFLPRLMVEVASWTGSTESSHQRMKAMHNLLADELQKIAEREVSK